jgi:transposase
MAKAVPTPPAKRRQHTDEFRRDAVQMLLDGHTAGSVAERLGIDVSLLYLWKRKLVAESGPVAGSLEERVRHLEAELLRVERERDILKKALAIFGRST